MALAITLTSVDESALGVAYVTGMIAASGNYSTGGDTINFLTATQDANFSGLVPAVIATLAPIQLAVWSQNGNLLFQYAPIVGSGPTNCLLKVGASATFGTELSAGAYPAGVTGDKITFSAVFKKLQ